jgi:hypothetical protein
MAIITVKNRAITLDAAEIPNLDASKITTGNFDASRIGSGQFADARISQSSVVAHSPQTDLQPVKSDISALALREATNESSAAFNLPNQFIDTFTDDTNLGTQTTVDRVSGYIASVYSAPHTYTDDSDTIAIIEFQNSTFVDSSSNNKTLTIGSPMTRSASGTGKIGSYAGYSNTTGANTSYVSFEDSTVGTGDYTMEAWMKQEAIHGTDRLFNAGAEDGDGDTTPTGVSVGWQESGGSPTTNLNFYGEAGTPNWNTTVTHPGLNTWFHFVLQRASGATSAFVNGTQTSTDNRFTGNINGTQMIWARISTGSGTTENVQGWIDHFRMSSVARYSSNFTPPTTYQATSATGTLIQSANTVGSAKTKVGGTMLYKDNAGTATLGTDLRIYFSCNGGTNWTEASSYSAITPVYSTGIKQVRLGETTCTSGSDVRYKAVWANQASGSKETQLHGIGINY